ncbi:MAG: SGNH/GDSL hydrolase family protein [Candidatus Hodarchaeota archaeon]
MMKVITIGDSLTQGNPPPEHRAGNSGKYQSYTHAYLKEKGIEVDIWNLGIGGQLIGQIVNRIKPALPADIVVIMGGTNDVWRFAAIEDDILDEVVEGILEEFIYGLEVVKSHPDSGSSKIILCSIPPFGDVGTVDIRMVNAINKTNAEIQDLCEKNENVFFCDVNAAMRLDVPEKFANSKFVVADGVHFTFSGNKACGEAIAKCIANLV